MNFYFEAVKILDKLDQKQGSIKGLLSSVPEKDRKRMSALVIESLKCTSMAVVTWIATLSWKTLDRLNSRQACAQGRDIKLKVTQRRKETQI